MYRQKIFVAVRNADGWNQLFEIYEELNALARSRGWAEGKCWTQSFGPFNEVLMELDYPDLATYEKQTNEFYADPEAMKLARRINECTVQGSGRNELWQMATPVS